MKKTLIKLIVLILVMCIGICNYSIAAGDNCELEVTAPQETYKPGDNVRLVLGVKNITTSSTGVALYQGTLTFDPNVFEFLAVAGKDNINNTDIDWIIDPVTDEEIQNAAQGLVITAYTSTYEDSKTGANIVAIYLRVKDNVQDGNYNVSFEGNELAGTTVEINKDNFRKQIKIASATPVNPGNNTIANNVVNNNVVSNNVVSNNVVSNNVVTNNVVSNNVVSNNVVSNNVVTNNVVSNNVVNNSVVNNNNVANNNTDNSMPNNTVLPYAGISNKFLGIGLVVLILAGITAVYKYNKYKSLK